MTVTAMTRFEPAGRTAPAVTQQDPMRSSSGLRR